MDQNSIISNFFGLKGITANILLTMGCPQLGENALDIHDALKYRCAFILEVSNKFNNYIRFPASTPSFLPVYLHHGQARLAPDYIARLALDHIARLALD